MRKQIIQDRQDAVYRQEEMKEQLVYGFFILVLLGCLAVLIIFILS